MGRSFDMLRAARFVLEIDNIRIGEFSEVTGLQNETEVVEYGEGGENAYTHKFRGATKYPRLTLKHGVTQLSPAIWAWREAMIHRLTPPMHNITLVILDDAGDEFVRIFLRNASPYKWVGPALKAGENALAVEVLELGYDDFNLLHEPTEKEGKNAEPPLLVSIDPPEQEKKVGELATYECVDEDGGPATTWQWKVDGRPTPDGDAKILKYKVAEEGDKAISVTAKDGAGKSSTAAAALIVTAESYLDVKIKPPESQGYIGEEVTLTCVEQRGGPATEWAWKVDGEAATGSATMTYKIEALGKRVVTVVAKNAEGKEADAEAEVHGREKSKLAVEIIPKRSSIALGGSVELTCKQVDGLEDPTSWTWTLDGEKFGGTDKAVIKPEFKELKDDVKVKVVAKAGDESAEAEAWVNIIPFRIMAFPDHGRIKLGEDIEFEAQTLSGGPILEWKWQFEGKDVKGEGDKVRLHPEKAISEGKVTVLATNIFGAKAEDTALLRVDPPPFRVKIEPDYKKVKPGTEVEFEAVVVEGGPIEKTEWTFLNKKSTETKPKGKFEKTGEFDVELVATDKHGTQAKAKAKVEVEDGCPEWKPTFTFKGAGDERYWGRYQFHLPDKGPGGENVVGIHWDFGPWNRSIKDAVKAKKAPQVNFPDKHDASKPQRYQNVYAGEGNLKKGEFPVAVLIRLQGYPNCAWVIETQSAIHAGKTAKGKSKPGVKIHYDGPNENWMNFWKKKT